MVHNLTDFLLSSSCTSLIVLAAVTFANGEQANGSSSTPESFTVLLAGVGLTAVGFVVRRHLRTKAKE